MSLGCCLICLVYICGVHDDLHGLVVFGTVRAKFITYITFLFWELISRLHNIIRPPK